MPNKKYNNPNITISKVYTKKGDKGKTELIGKKNVYKDDIRVKAYGELDELNVIVGGCCQKLSEIKSKNIKLDVCVCNSSHIFYKCSTSTWK